MTELRRVTRQRILLELQYVVTASVLLGPPVFPQEKTVSLQL